MEFEDQLAAFNPGSFAGAEISVGKFSLIIQSPPSLVFFIVNI